MTRQLTGQFVATPAVGASRRPRFSASRGVLYVVVIGLALMFMFPFLWTVISSFKTARELMAWPPTMIPRTLQWQNYPEVFKQGPFGRFALNTVIITGLATLAFKDEEALLAQADPESFNDEVLFPAKVSINLEYLQRVSFFEDIRLIVLTILGFHIRHPERERVERALRSYINKS